MTDIQLQQAARGWKNGLDTGALAQFLHVREDVIYNHLGLIRAMAAAMRAAA